MSILGDTLRYPLIALGINDMQSRQRTMPRLNDYLEGALKISIPNQILFFRPLRQYANRQLVILYIMHHMKIVHFHLPKSDIPTISIRAVFYLKLGEVRNLSDASWSPLHVGKIWAGKRIFRFDFHSNSPYHFCTVQFPKKISFITNARWSLGP